MNRVEDPILLTTIQRYSDYVVCLPQTTTYNDPRLVSQAPPPSPQAYVPPPSPQVVAQHPQWNFQPQQIQALNIPQFVLVFEYSMNFLTLPIAI